MKIQNNVVKSMQRGNYLSGLEERRIFRNQMKAELRSLAEESFAERYEELKRKNPKQNNTAELESEIENLKLTIAELKRGKDGPEIASERLASTTESVARTSKYPDHPSPPKIRSPSTLVSPIMRERNGMFVFGPDQSVLRGQGAPPEETLNIGNEIQQLFAPPQNLDESDYTLLRVFNPVKYPQPRKKLPPEAVEKLEINRLKLDLSILKHKSRLEQNKFFPSDHSRNVSPSHANESPRPAQRRLYNSSHDSESSQQQGSSDEVALPENNEPFNQTLDMLNPILDHFASTSNSGARTPNQIIVVKPTPFSNTYEERIFVLESRPQSRKESRADDAASPPPPQQSQPQQQQSSQQFKHQTPQSNRVADLSVEEFNQITEKMKDDIKKLVQDTIHQELTASSKNLGNERLERAKADLLAEQQQRWNEKLELQVARKIEELRSEMAALRNERFYQYPIPPIGLTENSLDASESSKYQNSLSPEAPARRTVQYSSHRETAAATASAAQIPHPPSQSMPSRKLFHLTAPPSPRAVDGLKRESVAAVSPKAKVNYFKIQTDSNHGSENTELLEQNSTDAVAGEKKLKGIKVSPPPPTANSRTSVRSGSNKQYKSRRSTDAPRRSSLTDKATPTPRNSVITQPRPSLAAPLPRASGSMIKQSLAAHPVEKKLTSIAKKIEKIDEMEAPSPEEVDDTRFISPIAASTSVIENHESEDDRADDVSDSIAYEKPSVVLNQQSADSSNRTPVDQQLQWQQQKVQEQEQHVQRWQENSFYDDGQQSFTRNDYLYSRDIKKQQQLAFDREENVEQTPQLYSRDIRKQQQLAFERDENVEQALQNRMPFQAVDNFSNSQISGFGENEPSVYSTTNYQAEYSSRSSIRFPEGLGIQKLSPFPENGNFEDLRNSPRVIESVQFPVQRQDPSRDQLQSRPSVRVSGGNGIAPNFNGGGFGDPDPALLSSRPPEGPFPTYFPNQAERSGPFEEKSPLPPRATLRSADNSFPPDNRPQLSSRASVRIPDIPFQTHNQAVPEAAGGSDQIDRSKQPPSRSSIRLPENAIFSQNQNRNQNQVLSAGWGSDIPPMARSSIRTPDNPFLNQPSNDKGGGRDIAFDPAQSSIRSSSPFQDQQLPESRELLDEGRHQPPNNKIYPNDYYGQPDIVVHPSSRSSIRAPAYDGNPVQNNFDNITERNIPETPSYSNSQPEFMQQGAELHPTEDPSRHRHRHHHHHRHQKQPPSADAMRIDRNEGSDGNSFDQDFASSDVLTPLNHGHRGHTGSAHRDRDRERDGNRDRPQSQSHLDGSRDFADEHKSDLPSNHNDESIPSVSVRSGRASKSRGHSANRHSGERSTSAMSRSSSKDESLRADGHYRSLMSSLLNLVDVKANVKKELKEWASNFEAENNRPPGNEDKAAISDRFLAYKMLSQQLVDLKEEIKRYEREKKGQQ